MSTVKKVTVTAQLQDNFRIEAKGSQHTVIIDQPKAGGGNAEGPNPLEYLLFSLAGCIGTIGRIIAKQDRIDLRGIDVRIEGELDMDKLMGKTEEGRPGFYAIKVLTKIDADLTQAEKEAFMKKIDSRCPISDNIENCSKIEFAVE